MQMFVSIVVPSSMSQSELSSFSSIYVPMLNAFRNGK